jgi:hypothetical protein
VTDRERTIFAAAEAVFGAGFVIAGVVTLPVLGGVLSIVLLIFGGAAVLQAVAVGAGLISVGERKPPK